MPRFLHGIINMYGEIIPVLNIHFIFDRPKKEIKLSDQFIIVNFSFGKLTILVDKTLEVLTLDEHKISNSDKIIYQKKMIKGVIQLEDGMVLINDVNEFLDEKELLLLNEVLKENVNS